MTLTWGGSNARIGSVNASAIIDRHPDHHRFVIANHRHQATTCHCGLLRGVRLLYFLPVTMVNLCAFSMSTYRYRDQRLGRELTVS
jgi:hypothetical protein